MIQRIYKYKMFKKRIHIMISINLINKRLIKFVEYQKERKHKCNVNLHR